MIGEHYVNLTVVGQNKAFIQFQMRLYTPLINLMNAYCDQTGLSIETLQFRYKGRLINEDDTPIKLNMQNQNRIKVYIVPIDGKEYVYLKVLNQFNVVLVFKVRWTAPLRKLMTLYCSHTGKSLKETQFRHNGSFINEDDTPLELNMKDQDIIYFY